MILAFWDADAPARQVAVWALSGALFVGLMAAWSDRETDDGIVIAAQYQTDTPQFERSPFFYWFYFLWPFATWAVVLGLAAGGATSSIDDAYIWFTMILFISLNSAFLLAGGSKAQLMGPTTLGLLILVGAIWLT